MIAAIIIGDLHLTANPRDAYRFDTMRVIGELLVKHKPERLVILGDLTEEKDCHTSGLTNDIAEVLFNFTCLCPVDVLMGNHDYKGSERPFFFFTRRYDKLRWICKQTTATIAEGLHVLYLPHTNNYKRDWGDCVNVNNGTDFIFAHNTFTGAKSEHGKELSGIPLEVLPPDVPIVSGDIHTPQHFKNLMYVGAPHHVDFGDNFSPRVLLLHSSDRELSSVPVPGPCKLMLDIASVKELKQLRAGDIAKVRFHLEPSDFEHWAEIKKEVIDVLLKAKVVPFLVQPILEGDDSTKKSKQLGMQASDEEVVASYAKRSGVSKAVAETGQDLLGG